MNRRSGARCGVCGRVSPGYDGLRGWRRWRTLDLGSTRTYVEAELA
ncbi:transposase family protein [Candidatus Nephthysia bennettiae]